MDAIERTVREAVPLLADFCLVHLVRGAAIPCVAAVHVSRSGQSLLRTLMRRHSIRRDDLVSSVAHVVRTHRPLLRPRLKQEQGEQTHTSQITELHRRLAPCSVLVVPITTQRAVLGALSLCFSESGRSYSRRHVAPARRIAARIAAIIHGATGSISPPGPIRAGTLLRRRKASAQRLAGTSPALTDAGDNYA